MMKNFFYFVAATVAIVFSSCSSGTTPKPVLNSSDEFVAGLTNADSTQMMQLCDECMELLNHRDIDGALSMIKEYDDESASVRPLPEDTRARLAHYFSIFPVLSYNCTEMTFIEQGINNVKYEIVFDMDDHSKTAFMFNPVKVDGVWHLTMKRADQNVRPTHEEEAAAAVVTDQPADSENEE